MIPGIGKKKSYLIVNSRPFKNRKDLLKISGIGKYLADEIEKHVVYNDQK
jgi:DNA uptake protein ComE-like DNA-binding protein